MEPSPTRMNLIKTKRSVKLAKKGYSILKKKREVLVMEFLKLLKDSTHDRSYMQSKLEGAYATLAKGLAYTGDFELGYASNYIPEPKPISITLKNIMGVEVPEIGHSANAGLAGYSVLSTSAAVDDINESFNEVLNAIIDLAKREQGMKRLVLEIEKVKRRVNALDYVIMPRMKKRVRYISMRLEEIDRDTFAGLKHIKRKLEKSK
jgi:V/A-type H+-transporting ATPase subunit D